MAKCSLTPPNAAAEDRRHGLRRCSAGRVHTAVDRGVGGVSDRRVAVICALVLASGLLAGWANLRGDGLRTDVVEAGRGLSAPMSSAAGERSSEKEPADTMTSPSAHLPCAAGTVDLGVHTGYFRGDRVRVRLCAIPRFRSSGDESTPGHEFYVRGARGRVLVSSRVSGAASRLFEAARGAGLTLEATSSFRTHRHQARLCRADAACRKGNYRYVAPPGYSHHQLGLAIDFHGTYVKGGARCPRRATDPASPVWRFLARTAHRFGFRQYAAESWHWDAMGGPQRC